MPTARRAQPSSGNGCLYVALAGGVLLIVLGAAVDLITTRAEKPAPVFAPTQVEATAPPAPVPAPLPAPTVDPFGPTPEPLPIVWLGEVTRSPEMDAGTACTLALEVSRGGNQIGTRMITLECDGRLIQQETLTSATVVEVPLGDGWYAYRLRADVRGLIVSTDVHDVASGAHAIFVEDLSVPRRWAPLLDENAGWVSDVTHRLRRGARVLESTGPVPDVLSNGGSCELAGDASPLGGELDCRLTLRCSGVVLYGAGSSGYNRCTLRDGSIVAANDTGDTLEDTDPRFRLDVDQGAIDIADRSESGAWTAQLDVTLDPDCVDLAGWRGEAIDASGARTEWTTDAATSTLRWEDGRTDSITFDADCSAAIVDANVGGERYRLWLGPGARTLSGERIGGARRMLVAHR